MGGYGSTRWNWHSKATPVEDCLVLDTGTFAQGGSLRPGSRMVGITRWTRNDEETAALGFEADTVSGTLRLSYRLNGEPVESFLGIESSPCRFGGIRWWWRCSCGRRILKAYLPPGGSRFACRTCYRLTYESVQEHDKRIGWLRRHPESILAAIRAERDPTKFAPKALLLALNAAADDICLARKRRKSRR